MEVQPWTEKLGRGFETPTPLEARCASRVGTTIPTRRIRFSPRAPPPPPLAQQPRAHVSPLRADFLFPKPRFLSLLGKKNVLWEKRIYLETTHIRDNWKLTPTLQWDHFEMVANLKYISSDLFLSDFLALGQMSWVVFLCTEFMFYKIFERIFQEPLGESEIDFALCIKQNCFKLFAKKTNTFAKTNVFPLRFFQIWIFGGQQRKICDKYCFFVNKF